MANAFVTFITTDSYLPGVLAMHRSLRTFNDAYPLVVLTMDSLSREGRRTLERAGCVLKVVEELRNPYIRPGDSGTFNHYTKLRVFALEEFRKLIFLDADLVICDNLEELFGSPHMSCVSAGSLIAEHRWRDLNGGFMVIEPSLSLFEEMKAASLYLPSADGTDQGFLQSFYARWPEDKALHLPHRYNVPSTCLDQYCVELGFSFSYADQVLATDIAAIHYWGPVKPWHLDFRTLEKERLSVEEQAASLWWDFYRAAIIDLPSQTEHYV